MIVFLLLIKLTNIFLHLLIQIYQLNKINIWNHEILIQDFKNISKPNQLSKEILDTTMHLKLFSHKIKTSHFEENQWEIPIKILKRS